MAKKKSITGENQIGKTKAVTKKAGVKKTVKKSAARATSSAKASASATDLPIAELKATLQKLLENPGTEKQCLELLLPLTEDERRELAPMCVKWARQQNRIGFIENPPGTFRWNPLCGPASVAAFCVCNFTDLKALGRSYRPDGEVLLTILKQRKPKWADQFAELLLEGSNYWNNWGTIREMVKLKLCKKPENPRYYKGIITGLRGRFNRDKTTVLSRLKADPELLKDEVWRLFEYEGDGENTLANVDRFEKTNWSGALVTLSESGQLSRSRLLASALAATQLGFNHYRAKWFFTFFDELKPTDKELRQHADTILELVGSPTPNVAQWAFGKTVQLLERGAVSDASRVIQAISPLLAARQKGTVTAALKLLDQVAVSSPKVVTEVCLTATEALGHEKADVQKAALRLIASHGAATDPKLSEAVQKYVPVVAASFRKQLQTWLGTEDNTPARAKPAPGKKAAKKRVAGGGDFDRSLLRKFAKHHIQILQIEPLIKTLESDNVATSVKAAIPAATFDGTDIPRLRPDQKLQPINDLNELLEVCGQVIEDESLIDDGERAIDGILRLGHNKPADFQSMAGPLFKRAGKRIDRMGCPFTGRSISDDLCGIISVWNNGQPVTAKLVKSQHGSQQLEITGLREEPLRTWHQPATPLAFMSQRSLDVCGLLISGKPHHLLSVPTHSGGWIDPVEVVTRIN